jgi:UDP-N-acetylmuramate dehydrogenase
MKLDSTAKYFITPTTFVELKKVLLILKKYNIQYYVIGKGSNIIFTNKEKECIIKLNFNHSSYDNIIYASELLAVKAIEFANKGYTGLEYISNIPASIGGAIVMNAGSYNHFFSDIIEYVYYLDENYNIKVDEKNNCDFSYRNSKFKGSNKIVLGCKVKLIQGDSCIIKNTMRECTEKRKTTQPIEFPNSGSIFKNKEHINAWKLIECVHLKGYKYNGAMISEKHCNFIINYNSAKSDDVVFLINLMKKEVKKFFNINLEEEVIILD